MAGVGSVAFSGSRKNYIDLAKTLPAKLLRFLARYPPRQILKPGANGIYEKTHYQRDVKSPFERYQNTITGCWRNPVYSLRRQADLVKAAREHGIENLLPYTVKKTEVALAKRVKYGLRVKGTGVGQKVKGHIYERQMAAKMDKRREAMLKMPALIREWKAVGKKKWTKWPK